MLSLCMMGAFLNISYPFYSDRINCDGFVGMHLSNCLINQLESIVWTFHFDFNLVLLFQCVLEIDALFTDYLYNNIFVIRRKNKKFVHQIIALSYSMLPCPDSLQTFDFRPLTNAPTSHNCQAGWRRLCRVRPGRCGQYPKHQYQQRPPRHSGCGHASQRFR